MIAKKLIVAAFVLLIGVSANRAAAGSLVLGIYPPKASATASSNGAVVAGHTVFSTVEFNAATGHLLAKANQYYFTPAPGGFGTEGYKDSVLANLTIDVDLVKVAGALTFVPNSPNNKLSVFDGSTQTFLSTHLLNFQFTSAGQLKFLWQKDGGAAALASPLPFIGAIISTPQTLSLSSFDSSFAPMNATTDIFMTPTPSTAVGGAGLFVAMAAMSKRRARVRP